MHLESVAISLSIFLYAYYAKIKSSLILFINLEKVIKNCLSILSL